MGIIGVLIVGVLLGVVASALTWLVLLVVVARIPRPVAPVVSGFSPVIVVMPAGNHGEVVGLLPAPDRKLFDGRNHVC